MSKPDQIQDGAGTESLPDLPVTPEQEHETKGGSILEGQLSGEGKTVTIHFCK